jgi:hypothetical protein
MPKKKTYQLPKRFTKIICNPRLNYQTQLHSFSLQNKILRKNVRKQNRGNASASTAAKI